MITNLLTPKGSSQVKNLVEEIEEAGNEEVDGDADPDDEQATVFK